MPPRNILLELKLNTNVLIWAKACSGKLSKYDAKLVLFKTSFPSSFQAKNCLCFSHPDNVIEGYKCIESSLYDEKFDRII